MLRRRLVAGGLLLASVLAVMWAIRQQLHVRPLRQHLYSGLEFVRNHRPLDAERAWKEALRLDADYWPAWRMLAQSYSLSGRWNEAAEAWEHVGRIAPREAHIQCELATACWMLGDEVKARDAAEEELRRNPRCAPALSLGARIAVQTDDQKKAIAYLRRALREEPNDAEVSFRLASLLVGAYRRDEARDLLQRLLRSAPDHADAHGLLGLCYLENPTISNHLTLAERHLSQSLVLDADSPDAHLTMGRLRRQQNRLRQALEHLDAAIVLDPQRQRAYFELAIVCDALGLQRRADKARQRFMALKESASREERLGKLCALEPNVFDHHLELGLIKMNGGDLRRAAVYLRRALELKPDHPQAMAAWKSLEMRAGPSASALPSP